MSKTPNLSERLRSALKATGASKYRIAKETGLSESTVSRFVNGEVDVLLANAEQLFDYAKVRVIFPIAKTRKPGAKP